MANFEFTNGDKKIEGEDPLEMLENMSEEERDRITSSFKASKKRLDSSVKIENGTDLSISEIRAKIKELEAEYKAENRKDLKAEYEDQIVKLEKQLKKKEYKVKWDELKAKIKEEENLYNAENRKDLKAIHEANIAKLEKQLKDLENSNQENVKSAEAPEKAKATPEATEQKAAATAAKIEGVKSDIENRVRFLEAEKAVEKAREAYLNEYKKCLADMKKDQKADSIKRRTFNFLAGASNIWSEITGGKRVEKQGKKNEEDFYTEKLKALKEEYDQARIALGNEMHSKKKAELVAAGVTGDELEKQLAEYKAGEILGTVIVNERRKTADAKSDMEKKLPKGFLSHIWDGYKNIQPQWKKYLLSTLIFTGAAAGGLGAAGIVGYAGWRLAKSVAIGTVVGHSVKGIDYLNKDKDAKFAKEQQEKYENLKKQFATGEMDLKGYEQYANKLREVSNEKDKKRFRTKAAVGMLIGGAAAFGAYGLMDGSDTHEIPKTGGDGQPWPPTPQEDNSLDVVIDKGQGEIHFADQLKHAVQEKWGSDMSNAPESVKHIANTSSVELAKEFGGFKPEQINESAMLHQGSTFHMDNEGNLTFKDPVTGESEVVMWGNDITKGADYHGKMFDYQPRGMNIDGSAPNADASQSGAFENPTIVDANGQPIGGGGASQAGGLDTNQPIKMSPDQINQNAATSPNSPTTDQPFKLNNATEPTRTTTDYTVSGESLHPSHPKVEQVFPKDIKIQGFSRQQFDEIAKSLIRKELGLPEGARVIDTPQTMHRIWMYENFGELKQTGADTFTIVEPRGLEYANLSEAYKPSTDRVGLLIKDLENRVYGATGQKIDSTGLTANEYTKRLIAELYK